MTTIYIEPAQESDETLHLVRAAIDSEIAKLELGLTLAHKRLAPFEQKYGVSSEYFITNMTAEDLDDQDDEYVQWAGEFKLKQRLKAKLQKLQEIGYADSNLLRPTPSNG